MNPVLLAWPEAAALLRGTGILLIALGAVLALEQALAGVLRALALKREPLVSDGHRLASYQQSIWTWSAPEVRALWLGLLACAICLRMVGLHDPLWALPAGVLFLLSLAWDLERWTFVAVSRWQIAWRCGWRGRIRRVPTAQLARVHRIETPAWPARRKPRRDQPLRRVWHRLTGSGQLGLELHNGHAVRLPATDLLVGRPALRAMAAILKARQVEAMAQRQEDRRHHQAYQRQQAERRRLARQQVRHVARRLALAQDSQPGALTAAAAEAAPSHGLVNAPPPLTDGSAALQRQVALLRDARARSRQGRTDDAPAGRTDLHDLPPADPTRPAPDTLMMG
ncbi:hypothetical protein ACWA7J_15985 [Leptothrix sp. BB-4]